MRALLCALIVVPVAGSGVRRDFAQDTPPAKTDMEIIQGTWLQTKRTLNGRKYEPGEYDRTLDVQGEKIVMSLFDFPESVIGEYTFSLDESKKPKWFTWTDIREKSTRKGIYEIKGDELTIKFDYRKDKMDQGDGFRCRT